MTTCFTPEQVNEAFISARPLIAQQILDLSLRTPDWLGDIYDVKPWPKGQGTSMQQLVFRGARPQVVRGFDDWKKVGQTAAGCQPCPPPDCSYNWSMMGGHAFQRKVIDLMSKDFRTPDYCVKEIQTLADYEDTMAMIIQNIFEQVRFYKTFNISQNYLTGLAKKFVVDSGGPKFNPENIYVYRPVGNARLSTLNIHMLELFYSQMRRMASVVPYDVVNGAPLYSALASPELWAGLYRNDPQLREDVRFSGYANDNLMKYNFMSTIRGMFIAAPILYPRRFVLAPITGEPIEVLPFINGVPGEVGEYTDLNPEYENATHEEVILHGRMPFSIFVNDTASTVGGGTDFGPEPVFMNDWQWVNPPTSTDPFRRVGYFATSAEIGLSAQFSEGIYGILVERPSLGLAAVFTPNPVCPVAPPECNNEVPDVGCPCPVVIGITPNPLVANNYYVEFATPITGAPEDIVEFQLDTGAVISGELVALSANGLIGEFTFAGGLADGVCTQIVSLNCIPRLACSSKVLFASDCRSAGTDAVKLHLERPILADTVGDDLVVFFGDCSVLTVDIVAIDPVNNIYTVRYAAGNGPTDNPTGAGGPPATNSPTSADMLCDRGGIVKVCVPTTVNASCPSCTAGNLTACVEIN